MRTLLLTLRRVGFFLLMSFMAGSAFALSVDAAKAMAMGDTDARIAALAKAVAEEPDAKTAAFIRALADDAVKVKGEQVWVVRDGVGQDPVTGEPAAVPDDAEDVVNNNRMRGELDTALAAIAVFDPSPKERLRAVTGLLQEPRLEWLPLLDKALAAEADAEVKAQLVLARSAVGLASEDPAQRLLAARALADSQTPATQLLLNEALSR